MNEREVYQQILGIARPWEIVKVEFDGEGNEVHVYLEYPVKTAGICPKCGSEGIIHDKREERVWRHLDSCEFKTFIHGRMPQVVCNEHGTLTMEVPWSDKQSRFTRLFERYAIRLIRATKNRSKAAQMLGLTWDETNGIMSRAVVRGMNRRGDEQIAYLGMDEKSFLKGHSYATILTDTEGKRVLDVVQNRDGEAVDEAWNSLSEKQKSAVKGVSMDFWQAFISGAVRHAPAASIVHDKFHIMKYLSDAVDSVRRKEHKKLSKDNDETLKGKKYLFLKNHENFTEKEKVAFEQLNLDQLDVGRAWNCKELFKTLWDCADEKSARTFFDAWYLGALQSQLKPIITVAEMLKRHFENIVTFLKHNITNGFAEGMNSVIQHIKATARGFRNFQNYRTAILFFCGGLDLYP